MLRAAVVVAVFASGCRNAPAPKPPATPADTSSPVATNAITVSVAPAIPYIELTDGAQLVNCDLRVRNTSMATFELAELQVSVYDRAGALVMRKFISGNGVSPSITTVPNRELGAEQELLILNPLHSFPRDLELGRLAFELTYERKGGEQSIVASTEVAPQSFTGTARLTLPVRGQVLVWDGHDFLSHHRRWDYVFAPIRDFGFTSNAGRYSYDFAVVDANGAMVHGDPARNESWLGFGTPILAPAAGVVAVVVSERPDDRAFDMAGLKSDLLLVYGNYIIIEHAPGELSMLAHLKQGSAKVRVGDRVQGGQEIAAMGASGSALMPHLHYQLQTTADGNAEGLPSYFHDFVRVRGAQKLPVTRSTVETGEMVEAR